ncbi:MAG TPA: hypothetical protein VNJ08_12205 [Bacteriovoracaceae bacterium]|nr:hypothetical protein [Bacteriovoracaceae bacterium]
MKTITLILSAAILVTSCSKKSGTHANLPVMESIKVGIDPEIAAINKLLLSDSPNLALAELLARTLNAKDRADVKELISTLTVQEAEAIIASVAKENTLIRDHFLFHSEDYQNDRSSWLKQSLISPDDTQARFLSLEDELRVTVFGYIKSKALEDLVATYENRAASLAQELAGPVAADIAANFPGEAASIEKSIASGDKASAIDRLKTVLPRLKTVDELFSKKGLTENEQYAVVLSGIMAGSVYMLVKENKEFKNVVSVIQKTYKDLKPWLEKAKELESLVKTLDKHTDESLKNLTDLKNGIKDTRTDLQDTFKEAKAALANPGNRTDIKEMFSLIKTKLTSKKDVESRNPSILSKQIRINANLLKSVMAVGNLADNLGNILTTTSNIQRLLGVKVSPEIQKAMAKAQKVAQVASLVKSAISGFATGGFLGAVSALGPMSSMLGAGGSPDSAKLDEVSQKLDLVLENQKKIMEMQLETMKMIRDLALMVDVYHQKEMAALAELREYSLVDLEMSKAQMHRNISICEGLINYQLDSVFISGGAYTINRLPLISSRLMARIKSLNDIRQVVRGVDQDSFRLCMQGISSVFSGSEEGNPALAIFASSDVANLYKWQREKYLPLLSSLQEFSGTDNFNGMPLHLPMKRARGLSLKEPYIEFSKGSSSNKDTYSMENLISVKVLERYLTNLLVLLPLVELDKQEWQNSTEQIISKYISNAKKEDFVSRSSFLLKNALRLTQTAIAQEALLAGEPLLAFIYARRDKVLADTSCDIPVTGPVSANCSIRSNKLLMKNLITYSLYQNNVSDVYSIRRYTEAFNGIGVQELAKFIDAELAGSRVRMSNGIPVLVVKVNGAELEIQFPTPEVAKDGTLLYSENMQQLLLMQKLILDALEKVTPIKRDHQGDGLIKMLLMGA